MRDAEQARLVERILRHYDDGTTDVAESTRRLAAADYRDPALLRQEIDLVLSRYPTIVAHISQLSNAGDFVTTNVAGVPVLVVCQADGEIGAFVNVCRHRGMQVALEDCGVARGNGFTCRWHGWRYDLSGALTAVPDQQRGFPDVDLTGHGLLRLPVHVRYGLVWVTANAESPVTAAELLGPLDEDLGPADLADYDFYGAETRVTSFNWKRGIEAFLESYHFRWIHPAMKKYYFTPDVALVDGIGRHVRLVAPKRSVLDQRDLPAEDRRIRPYATIAYHVFPATMLFLEKTHVTVLQLRPIGLAQCELRLLHVIRRDVPDTAEKWHERFGKFLDALDEDIAVLEASEHGPAAAAAAPREVVFGRNEIGLHLFRDHLADAVAEALGTTDN